MEGATWKAEYGTVHAEDWSARAQRIAAAAREATGSCGVTESRLLAEITTLWHRGHIDSDTLFAARLAAVNGIGKR